MQNVKWKKRGKTARGDRVIERVLESAQSLLQEEWLNKISIRQLSKHANVTRASLLLQFEYGWPEIASTLTSKVLFQEFDSILNQHLNGKTREDDSSCITRALNSFVDLAGETGKLVANLRSQMFLWGHHGDSDFHLAAQDFNTELAEVLASGRANVTDSHQYAAESLINISLDIAGGVGLYPWTVEERRELLTKNVRIVVTGLDQIAASMKASQPTV